MNHVDEAKEHLGCLRKSLPALNITRRPPTLLDYEDSYSKVGGYAPPLANPAPVTA